MLPVVAAGVVLAGVVPVFVPLVSAFVFVLVNPEFEGVVELVSVNAEPPVGAAVSGVASLRPLSFVSSPFLPMLIEYPLFVNFPI